MKNKLIFGVITLAFTTLAFYGGVKYQTRQTASPRTAGNFQAANGQPRNRMGQNGGATRGEVISADTSSLTVKMRDGSSKIVLYSANTVFNKAALAAKSDISTGMQVAVFGQANSDGSITAQDIQLNPASPSATRQ